MRLLVDGRVLKVDNDVRVIYDDMIFENVDGDEVAVELHVVLTSEGVIEDVVCGDEVIATNSLMAQEIVERLSEP